MEDETGCVNCAYLGKAGDGGAYCRRLVGHDEAFGRPAAEDVRRMFCRGDRFVPSLRCALLWFLRLQWGRLRRRMML